MNPDVVRTLPQASSAQGRWSALARLDGRFAWRFLVQPLTIGYSRASEYSASKTVGSLPNAQWIANEGGKVDISLPLSGYETNRTLNEYIESLANLQNPDSARGSPPVLGLVWVQRPILAPCVMTSFSKTEKFWYPDGAIAMCDVSFSLLEVPLDQLVN